MVVVLDRVEEMRRIDKGDALGLCIKTPEYCRDAVQRARQVNIPKELKVSEKVLIHYGKPRHIIVAGMGGSAIVGEMLHDWLMEELPIPIEVCRDYLLPAYAGEDTLVFAVSYSGNTEETLSAFIDAIKRKCMVASITSGGHLLSFSQRLQIPHVTVPSGFAPRVAVPYIFFPLPVLMEKMGVRLEVEDEMEEVARVLQELNEEVTPQVPTAENPSKKLALELRKTIPVVYGFRQFKAIARRLKCQFNENSKIPGVFDAFPELNHNEIVGWEAPEALTERFSVVLIRDRDEPPEIGHRIEATKTLALQKAHKVLEIRARGNRALAKMFSVMYIGDLASIYLAILLGVDPTPVPIIDKLKAEMGRRLNTAERLTSELQKVTRK